MYLNHYNLKLKPFEISPDPKFLWFGEKHKEAFAALKYGILENKGFMCLTGDVGTGKTTIVNALANSLGDNIIFAQISDPSLEELDFFKITADVLKMNKKFDTKGDFLGHLSHFLNNAYVNNKEVALIIEEAQRLDQELLEQVRLLSNIERPDKKLITIIFVGQIEFNNILKNNKALRQRITIIYNIEPLTDFETKKYIIHRLKVAGSEERIFSQGAIREIFSFSEGNPRLINIICDLALLTGYVKELKIIEPEIIRECAANFQLINQPGEDVIEEQKASANTIEENMAKKVRTQPAKRKIAYMASAAAIILACVFGYFYYFGDYNAFSMNAKTFLEKAIGRFTSSKSETSFQKADEITKHQSGITEPQVRQLDLEAPKAAEEIQLGQLKSRNNELVTELKQLQSAQERVAALESAVAQREQLLSESEQKLTELTKKLAQEKKSKDLVQAELLSNVGLVAELQKKLEVADSNGVKLEGEIENSKKEVAELQSRLMDLNISKSSAEIQLGQLKSRYEDLQTDLKELKSAKERVAELESAAVVREQMLSRSGQKLAKLAQDLDQEKQSKGLIQTELSSKDALVAELQEQLETLQSKAFKSEGAYENSTKEIAKLQEQLMNLKARESSAETQLGQLRFRNNELVTELKQLQSAEERVAELESAVAQREQLLSESEQKLTELANKLAQEKKSKDLIQAELLSNVGLVAELQKKLEVADFYDVKLEGEIENSKKEVAELQSRLMDLKIYKTSAETQLGQLKSKYDELQADLKELKIANQRVAELERAVAQREQMLSLSGQELAKLAQDLDQEKESKGVIQAELSSKVALVAELQKQLEGFQSNALQSEGAYENSIKEIAELQEQLMNLKTQASSAETQLGQLRSRNNELVTELKQLQSAEERVAELESAVAQREQLLSESEQKLTELAKKLTQEKKSKDLIQAELLSKDRLVAEVQEKLAVSETNVLKFEDEIRNSQTEIAELQGQLANLEAQMTPPEPSPLILETQEELPPIRDISETELESPRPTDIIDWIIKKKSK